MTQAIINSNLTGLAYAEEASLLTLPGSPVWYGLEPNSYSNFGAKYTLVTRNTINPSRQLYKGVTTDLTAAGGFSMDFTQTNLQRLMQGFFFANAHEKADTASFNSTAIVITASTTSTFTAASGLSVFIAGSLVLLSGFATASNNVLNRITAASGTAPTVATTLTAEASPPAAARAQVVGFQFAADDAAIVYSGGALSLTTTVADLTTLGLNVGEWIFLGGDTSTLRFVSNQGWVRVLSIAAHTVVLDKSTFTPLSETTTGSKTVQIFFGKFLRNELTTSLIRRRTYQMERQLGNDSMGVMSEYITGTVSDQFDMNIKEAAKIECDLKFVACGYESRTGTVGVKSGTRVAAPAETAFNTSTDVNLLNMSIVSSTNPDPSQLFGYVSDAKLSIKNSIKPVKAVGVLGAFDTTQGNFEVTGTINAYFTTVDATAAISNNSNVDLQVFTASNNVGWMLDMPLLALGNGELNVSKDAPITLPIETTAAQNANGYTAAMCFFSYLPTLAM